MTTMLSRLTLAFLTTSVAALSPQQPRAGEYPEHAVRIVVPYPAGGPNDLVARILAQKLSERLAGPFYVENLAGAGGTIGTGAVAHATADGYTLLIANQDLIVQAIIRSKVPYDPKKSFTPMSLVVSAPEVITVHPAVPAMTIKELLALLRAEPKKYTYASPGFGTSPHLASEWLFRLEYGLDIIHVPFQGAAPAVTATVAGHTQIFHNALPSVLPMIKDGRLRALAVASRVRAPLLPDVPTLGEAGVSGHEVSFWVGALAPAGTPIEIVERLQHEIAAIVALPDVKDRFDTLGFDLIGQTPHEFAALIEAESLKWRNIVDAAHIHID